LWFNVNAIKAVAVLRTVIVKLARQKVSVAIYSRRGSLLSVYVPVEFGDSKRPIKKSKT
jgi:hypothetical protein